jgi:hypothetical protein
MDRMNNFKNSRFVDTNYEKERITLKIVDFKSKEKY